MAVSLWQLVFSQVRETSHPTFLALVKYHDAVLQEEPALLKKWLHFLEKHPQVLFEHFDWTNLNPLIIIDYHTHLLYPIRWSKMLDNHMT